MSQPTLDERVAALEQEVARLVKSPAGEGRPTENAWRSTLGMFAGDATMKEVIDEGKKIRQHDREQPGE